MTSSDPAPKSAPFRCAICGRPVQQIQLHPQPAVDRFQLAYTEARYGDQANDCTFSSDHSRRFRSKSLAHAVATYLSATSRWRRHFVGRVESVRHIIWLGGFPMTSNLVSAGCTWNLSPSWYHPPTSAYKLGRPPVNPCNVVQEFRGF